MISAGEFFSFLLAGVWKGFAMNERINFKPIVLAASLLLALNLSAKEPTVTLHGEIMDSQCAYNVHSMGHSHDEMIHKGVEGAVDEKSCTQHCVKDKGGVYVLLVKEDVYRLDDQDLSERFAGLKVKVTGTLDEKTHTLHISKMEEER
jgi:hypothetical protein